MKIGRRRQKNKFCEDCRFSKPNTDAGSLLSGLLYCTSGEANNFYDRHVQEIKNVNPCWRVRREGKCGQNAKYFEAKT